MTSYRYSRWDGSQQPFAPDGDELFDKLADSIFDSGDLNILLSLWGLAVPPGSAADFDGDGAIGSADLNILLSDWGRLCP